MPSSSIDDCALVGATVRLAACGHTKRARSRRLANNAVPVMPQYFQITASPPKEEDLPVKWILEQLVSHQRGQTVKATPKIRYARCQPIRRAGCNSDHRADKISSTFMSTARSTPP